MIDIIIKIPPPTPIATPIINPKQLKQREKSIVVPTFVEDFTSFSSVLSTAAILRFRTETYKV